MLKEKHVPTFFDLFKILHERHTKGSSRRHCHANDSVPACRRINRSTVTTWRTPVVADDYCLTIAAEIFV